MEIKKQDVGIWINCKDELPEEYFSYYIRYKGVIQNVSYEFDGYTFSCDTDRDFIIIDVADVDWLKPLPQVYVFTEKELKELIIAFCIESVQDYLYYSEEIDTEKFLKSITKK